ncbi:MAG: hypothetical protein ABIZ80_08255 [Bryobacteraceae bacterium]
MLIVIHCIFLALVAVSESRASDENLVQWGEEIERTAGRIVFTPVRRESGRGEWRLPASQERQDIILQYLRDSSFEAELAAAHALTVNWERGAERYHFIVLNMDLAGQWENAREGLLGHELGHVWLHAKGLVSPPFEPGPDACISIQSADIVQHILIRAEMERRGISSKEYLLNNLKISLDALEKPGGARLTRCQRAIALSHWLDFRHGLEGGDWEEADRYEARHRDRYPDISRLGDEIEKYLREHEITGRESFLQAVAFVRERL